jgi:hypothetical protein
MSPILSGFSDVTRGPRGIFAEQSTQMMLKQAFSWKLPLRTLKKTPPTWREGRVGAYCREP